MKVKMLETYQGVGHSGVLLGTEITVKILEAGESYQVDQLLGVWLVDNRKAEELEPTPVHYGGQKDAELRHDDEKYEEMKAETSTAAKAEETEPLMSTQNQATTKRAKRGKA